MGKSKKKNVAEGGSPPAGSSLATRILSAARTVKLHRSKIELVGWNPRQITPGAFRKLCESVKRFGLVDPPIVNEQTGHLVGGHQRLKALDKVLETTDYEISVSLISVDDNTEKALNIALNAPTMQGQYDLSILSDIVGQLSESSYDIHSTGFSTSDFHLMFGDDFLTGVFREQVEHEAPQVSILESMRQAGKEADAVKRGGSSGSGSSNSITGNDPESDSDLFGLDDDRKPIAPSTTIHHPPESGAHQPGSPSGRSSTSIPVPDRHADPEGFKRALYERRKAWQANQQSDDAAEVMLVIVFDHPDEITPFVQRLGLDETQRYFDARDVTAAIDELVDIR